MDTITINVGITGWIVFWTTYWFSGILVSLKGHIDGIRPITELREVCTVLVINMMWSLIGTMILCLLPIRAMTDSHIIIKMIGVYLVTDIWFYHTHIMLHQPHLYQRIHKLHHRFNKPYALTALYSTPYEMIVSSTFSAGLGATIFQIPPIYLYIWIFITALNSICTHSGYRLSFLIDGRHDNHHLTFTKNFGVSPYLDQLYGTYEDSISSQSNHNSPSHSSQSNHSQSNQSSSSQSKHSDCSEPYNLGNFPLG